MILECEFTLSRLLSYARQLALNNFQQYTDHCGNHTMKQVLTLFKTLPILSFIILSLSSGITPAVAEQPKLIVQLTVDQLRGDLLHRYQKHFVNQRNRKGFNRFLEQGLTYTNTHYRHAATLTAVGHATLATGATPSQHGIIANNWFDPVNAAKMYCVADQSVTLLGDEGYAASPANLTAATFSDQLHMGSNGKSKIFGVSIKDRGAVLLAGHFGKAFWFNKKTGNFVSSSYYYDNLPEWAVDFNQSDAKTRFLGKEWRLSKNQDDYINDASNRIFQIPPKGFNRGFPHVMPKLTNDVYFRMIASSPFGDQMTLNFAKTVIEQQELGKDEITDYLSISFSINDYLGHAYGPHSIEAEDGLIKLDSMLAEFFYYLDKRIGLEKVLLVISADHGVDAIPEYKKSIGFAGLRKDMNIPIRSAAQAVLTELKPDSDPNQEINALKAIETPNIYFDHTVLNQIGISADAFADKLAHKLQNIEGIAYAFASQRIKHSDSSRDPILARVYNNFVQDRSGDIVIVQAPSTMMGNYTAATHGSPYRYDTHVPMHFAGWRIKPQQIERPTSPEDLAVTLSSIMHLTAPDRATGQVLPEVVSAVRQH